MALLPIVTLRLDLNNDGTYEVDADQYLQGYQIKQGRASAVDRFSLPTATIMVDNEDSRFSPKNASGPYYPDLASSALGRVRLNVARVSAAVTNYLPNPSLEVGASGWVGTNATLQRLIVAGYVAAFGLKVLENAAGSAYLVKQSKGAAVSSGNWTGSVWVKGVGDSIGKDVHLDVLATGGAGGTETGTGANVALTAAWQRISTTLNVSASDHTDMTLELRRDTSIIAAEFFYTDAWQLENAASMGEYIDGDQPDCAWSGTAHASTSTRALNPSFTIFTGVIRSIALERDHPGTVLKAVGITESILRHRISAGPFAKKPANIILQRLLDVTEAEVLAARGLGGELIRDGAFRFGGTALVAYNGTTIDNQYDTGLSTPSSDDPIEYEALEGDQVSRCSGMDADDEGWKLDVTSDTDNTTLYRCTVFLRGIGGAVGKQVTLIMEGLTPAGTGDSVDHTLTSGWAQVELTAKFDTGDSSTVRQLRVRGKAGEGFDAGGPYEFQTDGLHLVKTLEGGGRVLPFAEPHAIQYQIVGSNYTAEIEYLDAIDRSAGAVLDEVAKSVGGWYRENGSGELIFEDFDDRAPSAFAARLRLTDDPNDGGFGYGLTAYEEPTGSLANRVRVGSYGDVTVLESPAPKGTTSNRIRITWSLEPVPRAIAQNTLYTYFADYVAEGDEAEESQSSLILRRGIAGTLGPGTWTADDGVSTPYLINYGRGGTVKLRGESGGAATLYWLATGGRIQQRNTSERTFVETGSGEPLLELDMPGQGFQTTLMGQVRDWANTKYSKGPPTVSLTLTGTPDPALLDNILGREPGTPVWLRHIVGPYAFAVDGLFFVEGWALRHDPGQYPELTLDLEEA